MTDLRNQSTSGNSSPEYDPCSKKKITTYINHPKSDDTSGSFPPATRLKPKDASSSLHSDTNKSKSPPVPVSPPPEPTKKKRENENSTTGVVANLNPVVDTKRGEISYNIEKNTQKNTSHRLIAIGNIVAKNNIILAYKGRETRIITAGKINSLVLKSHKQS